MAITADTKRAPLYSKICTREARQIVLATTLTGLATILLFATTSYFDATRQGLNVHFGRGLWMYTVGFMPWFFMAPAVVILSKRRLFGQAGLVHRIRDGLLLTVSVFSIQYFNMLFVFAPIMGIPTNEIAGQVGLQAWIPDMMMFIIAVMCGRLLVGSTQSQDDVIVSAPIPIDIVVKSVSRLDVVSSNDVLAVSAQGNYVSLVTNERELLHRATLSHMRNQLDKLGFIQIHRSHLVKSREIASVCRKNGRVREVVLRNGAKLPVSPKGTRMLPAIFANAQY